LNETGIGLQKLQNNKYVPLKGGELFAQERIDLMVPFKKNEILIFVRNKGVFLLLSRLGLPLEYKKLSEFLMLTILAMIRN
jgi:hypothetical protein